MITEIRTRRVPLRVGILVIYLAEVLPGDRRRILIDDLGTMRYTEGGVEVSIPGVFKEVYADQDEALTYADEALVASGRITPERIDATVERAWLLSVGEYDDRKVLGVFTGTRPQAAERAARMTAERAAEDHARDMIQVTIEATEVIN